MEAALFDADNIVLDKSHFQSLFAPATESAPVNNCESNTVYVLELLLLYDEKSVAARSSHILGFC